MLFNKKASLEISIQAIVIIVLAMTLLGLGLGFIRGLFKNIGSTTQDVTEQVKQRILDDLITGDRKVSFPKTEISVDKGGSEVLSIGIRNKGDSTLKYKMDFTPISDPEGKPFVIDNPKWFQLDEEEHSLPAAQSDIRNVRLTVPSTTQVKSGSYFLTFQIIDTEQAPPNNVYAQKDFFVVVRG